MKDITSHLAKNSSSIKWCFTALMLLLNISLISAQCVCFDTIRPQYEADGTITLSIDDLIDPDASVGCVTADLSYDLVSNEDGSLQAEPLDCTVVTDTLRADVTSTIDPLFACSVIILPFEENTPVAACNNLINVNLNSLGKATITPGMLDEDSYDNCLIDTMWIDIEDHLGDMVDCDNKDDTLKVVLYVQDVSGNVNSCWGNVHIEDKLPPVIQCDTVDISCKYVLDPDEIDIHGVPPGRGYPTATDNCGDVTFEYTDITPPQSCPKGEYKRRWFAIDECGNSSSCIQIINITPEPLPMIVWPDDLTLDCPQYVSDLHPSLLPDPYSKPKFVPEPVPSCRQLAAGHKDHYFDECDPIGFKIRRVWNIVDWCDHDFLITHVQEIKVIDEIPPEILNCPQDITLPVDSYSCTKIIPFTLPDAIDQCDYDPQVVVKYIKDSDGIIVNNPVGPGDYTVTYCAIDLCGNEDCCEQKVTIKDITNPVTICDLNTVVSLTTDGKAWVCWETIDDGSFDNCELDRVLISRTGNDDDFSECIEYDCDDIGANVVYLRAWDKCDNWNQCWANIHIDDKLPPSIVCPPDVSVDCFTDVHNPDNTGGYATVYNSCSNLHPEFEDDVHPTCVGSFYRTWKVTKGAVTRTCRQKITITDDTPPSFSFPDDVTYSCDENYDLGVNINGIPEIIQDCEQLTYGFEDETFYICHPSAFKVRRTWKIIDWCNPDFEEIHYQTIAVMDYDAPTLEVDDITINIETNDCEELGGPIATSTDNCSDVVITNDSPFALEPHEDATGIYPKGVHNVTFTATDNCGNFRTKTVTITVVDRKGPTAICSNVSFNLKSSLFVEVRPQNLNAGSTDNCTFSQNLEYQLELLDIDGNPQGQEDLLIFTCDELGDHYVRLHVIDAEGNSDFCTARITIQDNNDFCPDAAVSAMVSGIIQTDRGVDMEDVEVQSDLGTSQMSDMSDQTGLYELDGLPTANQYTIRPYYDGDWRQGITTYDILLIRKHILGVEPFTTAYQWIAGDVNNDGKVTTSDILSLRRLILGADDEIAGNTSWRFVPDYYEFTDPLPLNEDFPEEINLTLMDDVYDANFIGIKTGDISGDAMNVTSSIQARSSAPEVIVTAHSQLDDYEQNIRLTIQSPTDLEGFQLGLSFDPSCLELYDYSIGELAILNEENVFIDRNEGRLSISWIGNLIAGDEAILLDLNFNRCLMENEQDPLGLLESDLYVSEAYDHELSKVPVDLIMEGFEDELHMFVYPNPFESRFFLDLQSPQQSTAELRISGLDGKLILQEQHTLEAGLNKIELSADRLPSNGIYIIEIRTPEIAISDKLIYLR